MLWLIWKIDADCLSMDAGSGRFKKSVVDRLVMSASVQQ